MAVLNNIRKQSVVLIAVIALALFAFILADLFRNSDALSSKSQNIVATINGQDIDRVEFMQKVENLQRSQGGRFTSTQVMNQVYDSEVRNAVMQTQFEALGLIANSGQIKDELKKNLSRDPNFLNESGEFDEAKLSEYITNLKETNAAAYQQWVDYEDNIAKSALQQNYINLVKASNTATLSEGELQHKLEGDKVDIKYVKVPYESVKDEDVTISDIDVKAYMNANKSQFEVDESRDIKYVQFKEDPSTEDRQALQNDLRKLITGYVEYIERAKRNDTILAFSKVKDNDAYLSLHSDTKFDDKYVFKSGLPAVAKDSIFTKNVGDIYGPYKDGDYYKLSKIVAVTKMPDSVKARHILIPFQGSRSADSLSLTKVAARAKVDSLLKIVKRRKSKFANLAKELSSDKGSGEKGGDLGYFTSGRMVPAFNAFCFEGKTGDIGIVESPFGFHIIDVQDQKNIQRAVKVATIARKVEASEQTIDKIFRDASNFELLLKEGGDFEAKAKQSTYEVRPVNTIKVLDENLPGLGNQRQIVRWAFEKDLEAGTTKRFNIPGGYAIVQLAAKNPKGLMAIQDAKVIAKPEILKEKKAEIIKKKVGTVATLQDLASSENQTVRTASGITMKSPVISGSGNEPLVVGVAFGLEQGKTSGLLVGDRGVYMIEVTKKEAAVKLNNYQSFANQVGRQKANAVNSRLFEALKSTATIEDNRASTIQ